MLTEPVIRRAGTGDAAGIVAIRDEAARWLIGRGIVQWRPGEVTADDVVGWLSTGRLYVAHSDGVLVGSVRVAWEDPEVWGPRPPDAGYIQALMTARAAAGQGLGRLLLAHAEGVITRSGRPLGRLSCLRGNTGLESFYAAAGYLEVGRRSFRTPGWDPVTLREKQIGPVS